MTDRLRIVVAGSDPDGHDRRAEAVARALRDAGMEVVYTGRQQTPEQIVGTVIQEDADAVGVSVPPGADATVLTRIVELLAENRAQDVVVFGGGIGSDGDVAEAPEPVPSGIAKLFTPGRTSTDDVVAWVRENVVVTDAV